MRTNVTFKTPPTPETAKVLLHLGDVIATANNMQSCWNLDQVAIELPALEAYVALIRRALTQAIARGAE